MRLSVILVMAGLLVIVGACRAPHDNAAKRIWAMRAWERTPATNDAGIENISALFCSYPAHVLGILCRQTARKIAVAGQEPAPAWKARDEGSVAYLGLARWGWSSGNFFGPDIAATRGGKGLPVKRGLLRHLNLLESEGERVMADFVWPLLLDDREIGVLVLRCAILAQEPNRLYASVFIVGDPSLALRKLTLDSYGGFPGAVPGGEQWLAGLTTNACAPTKTVVLPLDEYWAFTAHKVGFKVEIENRGAEGIFLRGELKELVYTGGWPGGSVILVPREAGCRALHFALSTFLEPQARRLAAFRAEAPALEQRLATFAWQPDYQAELARLDAVMAPRAADLGAEHPLTRDWRQRRDELVERINRAQAAGAGAAEDLACGQALQAARQFSEDSWPQAVKACIELAKRSADRISAPR